ncbi:hypothetical protein WAF17_11900 [Bernardetia sp. ABR2-2B]|uniref:hypothetical protein n=1 Tax=Bernardetia sp. ABR2-2B TaxID=3127472 RepID=UPI0030CA67DC
MHKLFVVALLIFISCQNISKSQIKTEIEKPILPKVWLSQIQSQEAQNRFKDVLEEIHKSTFYTDSQKDSLSGIQVRFANCEDIKVQYKLLSFLTGEKNSIDLVDISQSREVEWIKKMYLKDKTVATQSLKALVGTTRLDFADYSSSYYDTTYHPSKSFDSLSVAKPSEKVKKMEQEAISLIRKLRQISRFSYEEREKEYNPVRQKLAEKVKTLLEEPTAYEYALPLLSEQMYSLFSPDKKFRIYFINYHGEGFEGIYAYAHYRNAADSKVMVEEVDCHSEDGECYTLVPTAIFQTKKDNNPLYVLVSDISNKGMEWNVDVQTLEIKDDKIINCKDCVENKIIKNYDKYVRYNANPSFDTLKQELSFSKGQLVSSLVTPFETESRRRRSYRSLLTRYILKWNGKTFEEVELKPYCE